jgi:hypothetical protein
MSRVEQKADFSPMDVFKERVAYYSHSYVQENVLRGYDWRAMAEVGLLGRRLEDLLNWSLQSAVSCKTDT